MSSFVVGLTGGIGSGKSTVAELFAERGAVVVDTDAIAHEITGPGGAAMAALAAAFGPRVVRADGGLERTAMRQLVFADPAQRIRLEGILHPLIRERSAQRCRAAASPYVILAVPLLVEAGGYRARCQRILVVDCDEAVQVARVMARNGLAESEVRAIMAAQAGRRERLAVADDVVHNDGGIEALREQVDELHARYVRLSTDKPQASC